MTKRQPSRITPEQLAKSGTEHGQQAALFCWAASADVRAQCPGIEWMHAIPNGGSRGDNERARMIRGASLKAEGVKPAVSDIFLPVPLWGWHGFYIEMKRPGEKARPDQQKFIEDMRARGYAAMVCDHWEKARDAILQYYRYGQQS